MSISGISANSATSMYGNISQMKRPSPAEMADQLFSQLDSSGQGYIQKSDLESALSNINSSDNSTMNADDMFSLLDTDGDGKVTKQEFSSTLEQYASEMGVRARIQGQQPGAMPPPPQQDGNQQDAGFTQDQLSQLASQSTDASASNLFSQLATNFDTADTNGDGVITHDEAMSYAQDNGIDMPAPPQGGAGKTDNGLTQDQLSQLASNSTDSKISSLFSQLADNFDAADTNGDGVVTHDEAMAYQQNNASDTTSTDNASNPDAVSNSQLVKTLAALLRTYGQTEDSSGTQFSAST